MDSSFAAGEPGHARPGARLGAKPKTKPPPFLIPLNAVFTFLLTIHLISAFSSPISDCDETYNYWEPLHYLLHRQGLETWEYSPTYAIRSWTYILIHALPTKLIALIAGSKASEFYFLRSLLGFVAAACETRLYSAISRTLHGRIGVFYVLLCACTPGIWSASTAFLPSSFAMYTGTLGLAAFLTGGTQTSQGIIWFGMGALLGWPFAGALIIPFVLEDWLGTFVTNKSIGLLFERYIDSLVRCIVVLGIQCSIDALFYRKSVVVPWRIVVYNVFSGGDRGPDIFGTEPWHFYVRNLLINFNIWFVFAVAAGPLLLIQAFLLRQRTTTQTLLRTAFLVTPFYLWLGIFTVQPHKEERFMFPCYPFLVLNASIALHMLLTWAGNQSSNTLMGKIPAQVKTAIILPVFLGGILLGVLRIVGVTTAYGAPLKVLDAFQDGTVQWNNSGSLCYGKEWYRHPSTFLLPGQMHTRFIKSDFDGLLPGQFQEGGADWIPETWVVPEGMNDKNEEDLEKYVDVRECEWLVDSAMPGAKGTALEPVYIQDERTWEKVRCEKFLDVGKTGTVGRLIWTPDSDLLPGTLRRHWGEYCLLRRRKS